MPTGFDFFCLVVLGLICLCVPFIYRAIKSPRLGKSGRFQGRYISATLTHDPQKYKWKYLEHQKAMIFWFEAPLVEEFRRKALRLISLLEDKGCDPKVAPQVWDAMLTHHPAWVVATEPDAWMEKAVPLGYFVEEK